MVCVCVCHGVCVCVMVCVCVVGGGGELYSGWLAVDCLIVDVCIYNNNNNVHLSCAHQRVCVCVCCCCCCCWLSWFCFCQWCTVWWAHIFCMGHSTTQESLLSLYNYTKSCLDLAQPLCFRGGRKTRKTSKTNLYWKLVVLGRVVWGWYIKQEDRQCPKPGYF